MSDHYGATRVTVSQKPAGFLPKSPVAWIVTICLCTVALFLVAGVVQIELYQHSGISARKGKEATLEANIQYLQGGVEHFQADIGHFPAQLEELVADDPATLTPPVPPGKWHGPYLTQGSGIDGKGLPKNPFVSDDDTVVSHHWAYDAQTGKVRSAVEGTTLNGVAYTAL